MKPTLLTILVLLGGATASLAATRTVKPGGDFTTIQACVDASTAGDTCLVSAGAYAAPSITKSGTAAGRIRIQAVAGSTRPVITGRVNFGNESYITIDGFELRTGVSCNGCSFIEVKNNLISNTDIGIGGSGSGTSCGSSYLCGDDILIDGNVFPDRGDDVFKANGRRWVIRNNYANRIVDSNDEHIDFIQFNCESPGSAITDLSYVLLENNTYSDISGGNTHFMMMNCTSGTHSNYIVRQNKIRNLGSQPISIIEDGSQIVGVAIYNNVFADCCDNSTYAIRSDASPEGFQNNIYYNILTLTATRGVSDVGNCSGSLVFNTAGSISLFDGGCLDQGTGVIRNQNPQFRNFAADDFSLLSSSPAIDRGQHLTTVASSDSGSGTNLIVGGAYYFQAGWAGTSPDSIAVGSPTNIASIASINYSTNTITLASAITRRPGDPVYLYSNSAGARVLYGSAPDIGAVESQSTGSGITAPAAPTSPRIIR